MDFSSINSDNFEISLTSTIANKKREKRESFKNKSKPGEGDELAGELKGLPSDALSDASGGAPRPQAVHKRVLLDQESEHCRTIEPREPPINFRSNLYIFFENRK